MLQSIADDISDKTTSCLFYSLAFLYQTPGVMQDAINKVSLDNKIFVYGISDRKVGGIDLQKPDGNVSPVFPKELTKATTPEPFKSEPTGGSGVRLHHKFMVVVLTSQLPGSTSIMVRYVCVKLYQKMEISFPY